MQSLAKDQVWNVYSMQLFTPVAPNLSSFVNWPGGWGGNGVWAAGVTRSSICTMGTCVRKAPFVWAAAGAHGWCLCSPVLNGLWPSLAASRGLGTPDLHRAVLDYAKAAAFPNTGSAGNRALVAALASLITAKLFLMFEDIGRALTKIWSCGLRRNKIWLQPHFNFSRQSNPSWQFHLNTVL